MWILSVGESAGWVKRRFALATDCIDGLLFTLFVALPCGRRRQVGRARAGRRGQPQARPASHTVDRRRFWLPAEALVEFEGRSGLRQARSRLVDECCGATLLRSERPFPSVSMPACGSAPCRLWVAVFRNCVRCRPPNARTSDAEATEDVSYRSNESSFASFLHGPDDGSKRLTSTGAAFRAVVCTACEVKGAGHLADLRCHRNVGRTARGRAVATVIPSCVAPSRWQVARATSSRRRALRQVRFPDPRCAGHGNRSRPCAQPLR